MTAEQTDQRPRVFISYSRVDSDFAYRLRADLEASGFATWMDPNLGSEGGQNWVRMIQEAIDSCQGMVVIVSPDSAASEWVQIEYTYIRNQPGKLLIPIYYRTVEPFPMVLDVKERIEFRENQGGEDSYQNGLTNLIRSLAKVPKPPNLPTIPKASYAEPTPIPPAAGVDRAEFPSVASAPPEPAPEIREWIAGAFVARGEGNLRGEQYFLNKLVDSGDPQVKRTYEERFRYISSQLAEEHIAGLRAQAKDTMTAMQWRQAIGAWQSLLNLRHDDPEALKGLRQARIERAQEALRDNEFDDAVGAWQAVLRDDGPYDPRFSHYGGNYNQRESEGRTGLREALLARAEHAWMRADWTRAAESWQALAAYPLSQYGANEYLNEIKKNQDGAHNYQIAQQLLAGGNTSGAIAALQELYKIAPNYGDPAGIARQLNFTAPQSMVERDIERRAAEKKRREDAAATEKKRREDAAAAAEWLNGARLTALILGPANYLGTAIVSAVRTGNWWSSAMLANSFKLAWMSLLLCVAAYIPCLLIAAVVGNARHKAFVVSASASLFFALAIGIPGCWAISLWLSTGFHQGVDWPSAGIIAGAGLVTVFVPVMLFRLIRRRSAA